MTCDEGAPASDTPVDPAPDQLRELTEKAIDRGLAQQGIDALDPIVNPPRPVNPNQNLGREFPTSRR